MTDGEAIAEDVDGLDAAWDDLNRGWSNRVSAIDAADAATLRSLRVLAGVSPPVGRRIWADAYARPSYARSQTRLRAANPGGRPVQLVNPSAPVWGWLPAGFLVTVVSLAVMGGILFAGNDGDGITQTIPSDASSVVATLPSAAPAWATPGGERAD